MMIRVLLLSSSVGINHTKVPSRYTFLLVVYTLSSPKIACTKTLHRATVTDLGLTSTPGCTEVTAEPYLDLVFLCLVQEGFC